MRGDRPSLYKLPRVLPLFTPHARGSTFGGARCIRAPKVYPACAGIDPQAAEGWAGYASLPRMRGDRPTTRPIGDSS